MGVAVAKLKKNGRAGRSASASRESVKVPKAAAESYATKKAAAEAAIARAARRPVESYTDAVRRGGERTRLAEDAGKLFEAIRRFAKKHKLPRSLQRRLDNCTDALWDLEMEEDSKSGALNAAFGKTAECARRAGARGETMSLEEALRFIKERREASL